MADGSDRAALLDALHLAMRGFTNQVTFYSEAVAATVGLHPTDLDCLSVIELEAPLTVGRLADVTGLTTGAITGVVDRLERAGLVRRQHDPTDRRRVLVQPVAAALAPIGTAFVPMIQSTAAMAERYSEHELATITDYVTRSTPMLREETLRLRADASAEPTDADGDTVLLAGVGGRDATLRLVNGAARLAVVASSGQAQLFAAHFEGGRPTTRQEGDTVVVQYRRSPFAHFRTRGSITLDADRRWRVETVHGLAHCAFDLRATAVDSFHVTGGMSSVEVQLPAPGDVPMSFEVRGGVHAVTIDRPAGVTTNITVKGGASNLVVDDERYGAIGGGVELRREGDGPGELSIVVRGGASSLSVITRPQP